MKLSDKFRFVRQNMKKNKMRLFMTVLATAMSCAFLIVLASVAFGLQESLIDDAMEQQIVTEIQVYGNEEKNRDTDFITEEDIKKFEAINHVKAVTKRKNLGQQPLYELEGYILGAQTINTYFPSEIKAGMKLSKGNLPQKGNEIVVGYHFAENLSSVDVDNTDDVWDENGELKDEYQYKESIVNKTINMTVTKIENEVETTKTIPLKIVGVLEKPSKDWEINTKVFISTETYKEVVDFTGSVRGESEVFPEDEKLNGIEIYDNVSVYATNLEEVSAISDALKNDNYMVYSIVDEMKQINLMFTIVKVGLIFIGTIAIIISSIGIYNTMTMAVTERAPDIGIMKAIGASPKNIKHIFLIESGMIGLIGAFVGTIVSYGVSVLVNWGLPEIIKMAFGEEVPDSLLFSSIPPALVLISVGICLFVTVLSGLRPAKRATQIDVLKAMRREL